MANPISRVDTRTGKLLQDSTVNVGHTGIMAGEDERQQLIYDFKATFGTDAGQNVLKAIAKHCREDQNPYIQGSWDGTAYNCGMLEVIMYIRKQLAVSDEPRQTTVISEKENPNA